VPSSSADRRFHALEPTFDILVYEILTDSRLFCDCVCLRDELQRAQDQRVANKLESRCFAQYGTVVSLSIRANEMFATMDCHRTFLDVSAKVQDAASDGRHECVGDLFF
jgi:hypothetical protein